MGYFSNGSEGTEYYCRFCDRCQHMSEETGCPVWSAHILYSYRDCNKPDSILHLLIPRDDKGRNQQCTMFVDKALVLDLL